MSYLVIARKFRPQTFASVVGQSHITTALANAIVRDKVPHALLFCGPRGVGKTSAARVLARALNCTGRSIEIDRSDETKARALVEPCGECTNCIEIARSNSIAVWEIDGASNNSVDNIRELIDSLRSLPPPGSRYKIYIIDEVHMLSVAAFNALLKSLEEPPPNTIFVFATTEPHKIPETVLSRCQRHDFHKLPLETIVAQLREVAVAEGIVAEESVLRFVARKADGGMRDAQTLLDRLNAFSSEQLTLDVALRVFGEVGSALYFKLSHSVLSQNGAAGLELLDQAFANSLDIRSFLSGFITHFRNLLIAKLAAEGRRERELQAVVEMSLADLAELKQQVEQVSLYDLQRIFDIAQSTVDTALASTFPRFVLEAGVVKMATLPDLLPLSEVVTRIDAALASTGGAKSLDEGQKKTALTAAGSIKTGRSGPATGSKEINGELSRDPERHHSSAADRDVISLASAVGGEAQDRAEREISWHGFVQHVKTRSEPVLAAHLRRVSPVLFVEGRAKLTATEFDRDALLERDTLAALRACLYSYSGVQEWDVVIELHTDSTMQRARGAVGTAAALRGEVVPRESASLPDGSLAMAEVGRERERVERISKEAQGDPLVQQALTTFSGSRVEKVSVIKG